MARQGFLQKGRGLRRVLISDDFWTACGDHEPALVPGAGSQVYYPIGVLDEVHVMFDQKNGIPLVDQSMQDG